MRMPSFTAEMTLNRAGPHGNAQRRAARGGSVSDHSRVYPAGGYLDCDDCKCSILRYGKGITAGLNVSCMQWCWLVTTDPEGQVVSRGRPFKQSCSLYSRVFL